jgi:peroxiredoxin
LTQDAQSRRGNVLAVLVGVGLVSVALSWFTLARGPAVRAPGSAESAPQFELENLDGGEIALSDLRGKVVYVNFWATWCVPCRDEAPGLRRLYETFRGEGFEILAPTINVEADMDAVRAFRSEFGLEFPILLDPDKVAYNRYGATGVPETYLIDAEGRLAASYIGPQDFDDPRFAAEIQRLLLAARSAPTGGPAGG